MNRVITVSREFGSGGRELGRRLAEYFKIPFYDKELISMAAEQSDMAEAVFKDYDENLPDLQDEHRIYALYTDNYQIPMSDQIFVAQSSFIRHLAGKGPCVIVGRCADRILEDSINLFIYAKIRDRVKRLMDQNSGSDPIEMERKIREVDQKRKDYYQYYTGAEWGKAQNYHLCMESGLVGVDGCLRAVLAYLGEEKEN